MSDALDEDLLQRIDARGTTPWSATCFRYTGAHRDPLSGEGARRFGGRWNPPLLFSAIYLSDSAQACMVEVGRAAQAASTTAEKLLEASYRLHTVEATDLAVLDLTTPEARDTVGLEDDVTSTARTGRPAKQWATPHGFCTCKAYWCPQPAESASSSPPTNNAPDPASSRSATARI